ncbi:integrase core domain-containing protein [Streptomyces sp. NBC_00124]|uniref:integrase core domain-containing protein n=1 Tax=Streptomyces sp. NBC_00124 TaxID=2975662 RepID=UPI00338FE7C9
MMSNWSSPPCTWPRRHAAGTCAVSFSARTAAARAAHGGSAGPAAGWASSSPWAGSARASTAVSEAFNSVLKVEYVHRHTFATRTEARIRIATWITDFYNARRLHSVCGWKSPIDYEHDYWASLTEELAA